MTVPFSRAQQRQQQIALTPERTLQLARRELGFRVSWRYRDDWLRKRCDALCKQGLLRSEKGRGETIYYAMEGRHAGD